MKCWVSLLVGCFVLLRVSGRLIISVCGSYL